MKKMNTKHKLYLRKTSLITEQALWTLHLEAQQPVLNKPLSVRHNTNSPVKMSLHSFRRVNSMEPEDFRKGNIRLLFVPENKRAFCRYQTAIRYGELSAWLSQCSKRWGDNTQQRQASLLIAHRIFIDQTISHCLLYANKQQRQGNRAKEGWTRGSN